MTVIGINDDDDGYRMNDVYIYNDSGSGDAGDIIQ